MGKIRELLKTVWAWLWGQNSGSTEKKQKLSTKKEARPDDGPIGWVPRGFDGSAKFKLPNSPFGEKLEKIRTRAVLALFWRLGLQWVPGEYWSILDQHPDPIDALDVFLQEIGVSKEGARYKDAKTLSQLEIAVGILLELENMGGMSTGTVERIKNCLRCYGPLAADALINRVRAVRDVLHEAQQGKVVFPDFNAFVEEVQKYESNPLDLTDQDVAGIRGATENFSRWQEQFSYLIVYLDQAIGWVEANWPAGEKWAEENEQLRQGLILEKERAENQLTSGQARLNPGEEDFGIPDWLNYLGQILADIRSFIEEIQRSSGGKFNNPKNENAQKKADLWKAALKVLGIPESSKPTEDEIKKIFRKLAMKVHPDRLQHLNEQDRMEIIAGELVIQETYRKITSRSPMKKGDEVEDVFKVIGEAYNILLNPASKL